MSANPTKWSKTLKQFVGNLPTNWLTVFDHFMRLALKGLTLWRLVSTRSSYLPKQTCKISGLTKSSIKIWMVKKINETDKCFIYFKWISHLHLRMLKTVNYVPQNVSTIYLNRLWAPYNLGTQKAATKSKTNFIYGKLLRF